MKFNLLLFVLLIIFTGCNIEKSNPKTLVKLSKDAKTSILGNWRLSDVSQIEIIKNEDALLAKPIFKKRYNKG